MIKWVLAIIVVIIVVVFGFFAFNSYIYNQKQAPNEQAIPYGG